MASRYQAELKDKKELIFICYSTYFTSLLSNTETKNNYLFLFIWSNWSIGAFLSTVQFLVFSFCSFLTCLLIYSKLILPCSRLTAPMKNNPQINITSTPVVVLLFLVLNLWCNNLWTPFNTVVIILTTYYGLISYALIYSFQNTSLPTKSKTFPILFTCFGVIVLLLAVTGFIFFPRGLAKM